MQPAAVLVGRRKDDEHGADVFVFLALACRRLNLYQVDPGGQTVEANLALFVADA
ncbi:hypothetical protein QP866_11785 [Corynebacterium imitans]|uniref:hypothetical protein n=1 Tax=Corynebacterium imitans TaxID=156978 RepID=UPI0025519FF5|nr:hypothetical protein [Corynebacterium imitans]MDK8307326.1 hypothetical protein [Corynebacterium imitans]MDK8638499.1 hypothetical protein [Corynebacterium imitans]MDK8773717.1 hypothetical protein [Corynebacterium imitans]